MELKTFNRNVKTIGTSGAKLDALVHLTAVGGLGLIQQDGNATRMDQLLKALPKGYRQKAFQDWVVAHSPIRWNGDGAIGLQKPEAKGFTAFNIEAAEAVPFWDFTEENAKVRELSLDAIMAILKREADKVAKADKDGNVSDDAGKVKFTIKGNVIDLAARIEAARAALATPTGNADQQPVPAVEAA